jgi:hypothetical protein
MAEARRLKGGKWRIYVEPNLDPARDPWTGTIAIFESLEAARSWWGTLHPGKSLCEANKCAWCGAYFGRLAGYTSYGGRYYHPQHTPPGRLPAPTVADGPNGCSGKTNPGSVRQVRQRRHAWTR